MAESFVREPTQNGDNNVWAAYLLRQIRNNQGILTSYLYNDSGTLKLKTGVIGINDGTNQGTIVIDADKTISLALCSVSNWAKIELSVSGTSVIISASDLTGGTDPATLHADFKNSWRGDRGGFYITATKRCIGLAWKNASGVLEGIINCLPLIDGWIGYCQSNDANDYPYRFEKNIDSTTIKEGLIDYDTYVISGAGGVEILEIEAINGTTLADMDINFYVKKPCNGYIKGTSNAIGSDVYKYVLLRKMFVNTTDNAYAYNSKANAWGIVYSAIHNETIYFRDINLLPGRYTLRAHADSVAGGQAKAELFITGAFGTNVISANTLISII